jgi:peptidoglycan/xylan/chitin deacetylase (PgdA/CDA1 family)
VTALRVFAALAFFAVGGFGWYELVESPRTGVFAPVVTHGRGHAVALTFDDGPTRGITDRLLDVLERERVPGTFFVVGTAARREPALLRRMIADGDEIENHSQTHAHLNVALPRTIDAEVGETDDAIAAATGRHAHWLRPPFGARNAAVLDCAARRGMRVVLWSAMLDETSPHAAPATLVQRLLAQVGDGAIVVLHDGDRGHDDAGERAYEASLAPLLIAALRAKGYRFVTLDQLVAD